MFHAERELEGSGGGPPSRVASVCMSMVHMRVMYSCTCVCVSARECTWRGLYTHTYPQGSHTSILSHPTSAYGARHTWPWRQGGEQSALPSLSQGPSTRTQTMPRCHLSSCSHLGLHCQAQGLSGTTPPLRAGRPLFQATQNAFICRFALNKNPVQMV